MSSELGIKLRNAVSRLVPLTHHINLELEYLNTKYMVPDQSRLVDNIDCGLASGELQLPDLSWLLIDESKMNDGKLLERGVLNVRALGEAINQAVVHYGIPYGTIEKTVDFQCCIISEAKSLFGVNCIIPFSAVETQQVISFNLGCSRVDQERIGSSKSLDWTDAQ
jgi:Mini-chromosome maintenance replisome factor